MPRIYLDHAATTPMRPEAIAAVEDGMRRWANPSSPHAEGRAARSALEEARARIKAALGWQGELIFTSGASEALAIGLGRAKAERRLVSPVEHDAVFRAAPDAEILRLGEEARVDADDLAQRLSSGGRAVVAIQHINSETGTLQLYNPTDPLIAQVREAGGIFLSDCAQSAGKLALPDADLLVVSAHKLGGPPGIGALLVRDLALLEPTGGHEFGYRAGTENLPGALGFAAAAEAAVGGLEDWQVSIDQMFDFKDRLYEGGEVQFPGTQNVYILAAAMNGMSAAAQLIRFDAMGISISAGSACSSGTLKRSRALAAFGIDEATAERTVRISIGWNTTPQDLDIFAKAWSALAAEARNRAT